MVKMNVSYQGDLRCSLTHEPSGSQFVTDAPKDNMGKGESFSPTDLVGAALASCILTTMAIVAKRESISFEQATASVVKEMVTQPTRKIGSLAVKVTIPGKVTPEQKEKLERAASHCPVHKSLHPDVQMPIEFNWVG